MFTQTIQHLLDAGFPPEHMIIECRKQIAALEALPCAESEDDALEVIQEIEKIKEFMGLIKT